MDFIWDSISRGIHQLLDRASGPMHLRLLLQPTMATILAVRAGLRDAKEGQPAFLWTVLTSPAERRLLLESGWKDIGRLFVLAIGLDTAYQVAFLGAFYPLQTAIVAVTVAFVPYVLVRGPVTRVARRRARRRNGQMSGGDEPGHPAR